MELNVKMTFISTCSLFLALKRDLSNAANTMIVPVSQLQTQQMMTSQIRSHIEYLIQIYYILELIL